MPARMIFVAGYRSRTRRDDGPQVPAGDAGVDAPKPVVPAELENEHVRTVLHHPVDTAQAARRGLPAHASVDHPERPAESVDLQLHELRKRLVGIDPVPRRQAVAIEQHGHRRPFARGGPPAVRPRPANCPCPPRPARCPPQRRGATRSQGAARSWGIARWTVVYARWYYSGVKRKRTNPGFTA